MVNQLKILLEPFLDKISYIYIGGSAALSFINSPSDYDIVIIFDNPTSVENFHHYYNNLRHNFPEKLLYNNKRLDFHVYWGDRSNHIKSLLNSLHPFYLLYDGVDLFTGTQVKADFTIEEFLSSEPIIKQFIYNYITRLLTRWNPNYYRANIWYHILINIYIFKNKNLVFLVDQQNKINLLHDKNKLTNEKIELIQTIIQEVITWQR